MISVVDDDPSVRRALRRLLRSFGFEVETFGSADEFFDCDWQREKECVILDIHLGEITGFELQQRIMDAGLHQPIIFITAHEDEETFQQAMQAGAIAYLPKPFQDQSLMDAI